LLLFFKKEGLFFFEKKNQKTIIHKRFGVAMHEVSPELLAACFAQIAARGWHRFNVAEAARAAGFPLDQARRQISGRVGFLLAFGRMADAAAVAGAAGEGAPRDRLFDVLMRRIDVLQAHRAGVIALLQGVMFDPAAALLLARASVSSMGWMLAAAGIEASGPMGQLRRKGLLAVWLWTIRAWRRDEAEDLAVTMAALDQALAKAGQVAGWLGGARGEETAPDAVSASDPLPEGEV
jgi:hypothetical protein